MRADQVRAGQGTGWTVLWQSREWRASSKDPQHAFPELAVQDTCAPASRIGLGEPLPLSRLKIVIP
jgi:hypothetical protein